mgnify:CR=1 FL=1
MLRPYQQAILDDIFELWKRVRYAIAVLPTGGGKTVVMGQVIKQFAARTLAIAHRQELVEQISLALARAELSHRIIAPDSVIRAIIDAHVEAPGIGRSWYDPGAEVAVAGIDTLIKRNGEAEWLAGVKLWVIDEAHHVLESNKWGKGVGLLPEDAKGLGLTATPLRADKKALRRGAGGVFEAMTVGPSMRELIGQGHLKDYRVFGLPQKLDMRQVKIASDGDFNAKQLRDEAHRAGITGDIVAHAKRLAPGKPGVTFAVDIELATEYAQAFRDAGVSAAVLTGVTPAGQRREMIRAYRGGTLQEIANVDVLGEGFDCPGIIRVSMARPTMSYGLFAQQFGRALRPLAGEPYGIICDHVGNVQRHGLPDGAKAWSLDSSKKPKEPGEVPTRVCVNPECMLAYEGFSRTCPHCGHTPEVAPGDRTRPEVIEGDLTEYDPTFLAKLRGEADKIMGPPIYPSNAGAPLQHAIDKRWMQRQNAQADLRDAIANWAGYWRDVHGSTDSESYRRFWHTFGIDVATACVLPGPKAMELADKVRRAEIEASARAA